MNKKRLYLLIHLALAALLLTFQSSRIAVQAQDQPLIGLLEYSQSGFAADEQAGIIVALNQAGFVDGQTAKFVILNGKGDSTVTDSLAKKLVDQKATIILSLGTPATQSAAKATTAAKGPPIVFAGLTDPFAAGIAKAACDHPIWITGTQALDPFEQSIALIKQLKPDAKTIGIMYSPDEANAVIALKLSQPLIEKAGLTLFVQAISKPDDVTDAAKLLLKKRVDVFYVFGDNTVDPAISDLTKVATDAMIPVISTHPDDTQNGVVVAVGIDYEADGVVAGRMAAAILNKKLDVAQAKIMSAKATFLSVNTDAATALGLTLPDDILKSAAITYRGGKAVPATAAATLAPTLSADDEAAFLTTVTCTAG